MPATWLIPALVVRDVSESVGWYQRALGFELCQTSGDPPSFAIIDLLPGRALHLRRGTPSPNAPRGDGIWDVYLEFSDLDALIADLAARAVPIVRGPEVTAYGMREVEVRDPDGYSLCFAEPV